MNTKQLLLSFCLSAPLLGATAQEAENPTRVMEMRADRMYIYPQRMNLNGEETLGDILAMYPDLMQSGFSDLLDGYALRIDNVAINSDNRVACELIKANTIERIQICDNTGVAKGTVGMGRVIDINLVHKQDGWHGTAGIEAGTDNLIEPHTLARYGDREDDFITLASYAYQDRDDTQSQRQNLFTHLTHWFSPRDRLLTYATQQYSRFRYNVLDETRVYKKSEEKGMARARYFHTFNDAGTELLIVGSYQHAQNPIHQQFQESSASYKIKNNSALYIVELNTPLTRNMDMMLGVEGDFSYTNRGTNDTHYNWPGGLFYDKDLKYMESNNDLYLQLNYLAGPWRFTLGDRVMFYHYAHEGMKHNDTRNNIEASAIVSLKGHSQLQAAYHKKFLNPNFFLLYFQTEDDWRIQKEELVARYIDEAKVAYTYSRPRLTVNLASYYQKIEQSDNVWRLHASTYLKQGILALTAGANLYVPEGSHNNFATFRLAPHLYLPHRMQVNLNSIFATHHTTLSHDEDVYMALQWKKLWGQHLSTALQWHDIFSHHYAAVMATLQYRL